MNIDLPSIIALIATMNKEERKEFSIQAADTEYKKLFRILCMHPQIKDVHEITKKYPFKHVLKVIHYLGNALFYHWLIYQPSTAYVHSFHKLTLALNLKERELYTEALEILNPIKAEAIESKKHELATIIIKEKIVLHSWLHQYDLAAIEAKELHTIVNHAFQEQQSIYYYVTAYKTYKDKNIEKAIEWGNKINLFLQPNLPYLVVCRIHNALILLCTIQKKYDSIINLYEKMLECYEKEIENAPWDTTVFRSHYVTVGNYIGFLSSYKKLPVAMVIEKGAKNLARLEKCIAYVEGISKLEYLPPLREIWFLAKIKYCFYNKDWEELIQYYETHFSVYNSCISIFSVCEIVSLYAVATSQLKEYKKTISELKKLFRMDNTDYIDISCFVYAKLILIIAEFENGNIHETDYIIKNLPKQSISIQDTLTSFVALLQAANIDWEAIAILFQTADVEIVYYFDIQAWIQSKASM